ncbi:SLC13 family permease [Carboxydothermus hydrogenoformans]|uniref:Arsenic transporter family protein n=1 Tax=Carboxydothermus hydrogenoformans (strain ATCC BAA-161 / DSM 6008 / Z-2901) TaxID=246194 RepID=Q3AAJ5_CARHZ|nr:ArsB/NhaD family transporter [Carboxydothermus hydrogenoformans]ABB14009.1 arsenic transporter family protein [Carboxydothermus hydrogenoformans Z-2901]
MFIAIAVFLVSYLFIITEKINRTAIALLGGTVILITGTLTQEEAIHYIDWNTLGLLLGMMIIVDLTKHSGLFEYLALKAVHLTRANPIALLIVLGLITAFLSAILDNVTTVLLIVPVALTITRALNISPYPFLINQILMSNIGGTATLIGDPPNIMIGSQTHLGFIDFLINLSPVVLVILIVTSTIFYFLFRKSFAVDDKLKQNLLALDPKDKITDYLLLKKSLIIIALTILGFSLHQLFHLESATVALFMAMVFLAISGKDIEHVLLGVEWPTIFFFLGLFIMVGALEETGVIHKIAVWGLELTKGNVYLTGVFILWVSAIASAFIDNIPFVATMIPLIKTMGNLAAFSPEVMESFWWSLALGACLGGNGTIIGASANVIVAGIAEKEGYPISYGRYFVYGFPLMLLSIIISMVYLTLFYFM